MIAVDQTRLLITGVILGFVLAVLLFRPEVFPQEETSETPRSAEPPVGREADETPTPSIEDLIEWQHELEARERGLEEHSDALDRRESKLDEREAGLDRREREIEQREADLLQAESRLEERTSELDRREAELDRRESELNDRGAALDEREARLRDQQEQLESRTAALRKKEALLAEQEQRLRGWRRLSIVALVLVGLLALPSLFVSVALVRHGRDRRSGQRPWTLHMRRNRRVPRIDQVVGAATISSEQASGNGKETTSYTHSR
jgi:hypothetical protein